MKMKRMLRCLAAAAALCLAVPAPCRAAGISARAAIVIDADTGKTLYEKNADERALIASTTKIMTGYLACELCAMDEEFTVPQSAVGIEGSSIYLRTGERVRLRTLLYGALLQSGNDAATALAIAAAGDVGAFVTRMNQTAQALGLQNTRFANPHGLDSEDNYSTARDLAKLTRAALQNPVFAEAVAAKTADCEGRSFVNHNKLLWRCEGAIGVKTGYTKAAGRILVSAVRRGGRTLIAVTINAPDDWSDHERLYDELFSLYSPRQIASAGRALLSVPTGESAVRRVELVAAQDLTCCVREDERVSFELLPQSLLLPPFPAGEAAGTVAVRIDGAQIASVPVVWGATVLR